MSCSIEPAALSLPRPVAPSASSRLLCPSCGGSTAYSFSLPHTLVWRCSAPDCRLLFAHPQLSDDDLARAYTALYYPSANGNGSPPVMKNTSDDILVQVFRSLEHRLGKLANLRLLDYGCGVGSLMRSARRFGLHPTGIESDPNARRAAAFDSGARTYPDIANLRADIPHAQFDLITLWNVIEHLRRPWETLAELRALLRPGGVLLISTNDTRCLRAFVLRARWEQYQNPTHFYYFDRFSLSRVIRKSGFSHFSEWRLCIRFRHHGLFRRWLYKLTFALRRSDGLYFFCANEPLSYAAFSSYPARKLRKEGFDSRPPLSPSEASHVG